MAYKAGEIRDDAGNIIQAGTWGIKSPYKDIVNISAGNFDAIIKGGIVAPANFDASKITSGIIDIARIPAATIERMTSVANQAARFALTTDTVQAGDCVLQLDTNIMYWVIDATNLGNDSGYHQYNAGTAASVPWSGVTGKPTDLAGYGITNGATSGANSNITSLTGLTTALSIAQGGTGATTAAGALANLGVNLVGVDGMCKLSANQDLNTLSYCGFYYANTPINAPSGACTVSACYVLVEYAAAGYIKQTATAYDGSGMFTRVNAGGTWSPWKQIVFTDNATFTGDVTINTTSTGLNVNQLTSTLAASITLKNYTGKTAQIGIYDPSGDFYFYNTAERVRITANGNVGINKTSPLNTLDIDGNIGLMPGEGINTNLYYSNGFKHLANGHGSCLYTDEFGATHLIKTTISNTSGAGASATVADQLVVAASGNVGIGTTTIPKKFQVNTAHTVNIDDDIRLGSYANVDHSFYGLGLNYRIDSSGAPSTYIVNYRNDTKFTNITLSGSSTGIGEGMSSPGYTLQVGGTMYIQGHQDLPAWGGANAFYTGGWDTPCSGKVIIGDGTGWKYNISNKDHNGTVNDLFTFVDDGRLGIGTAPALPQTLTVHAVSGFPSIGLTDSTAHNWCMYHNAGGYFSISKVGVADVINISDSTRAVGIGTTSPQATLHSTGTTVLGCAVGGMATDVNQLALYANDSYLSFKWKDNNGNVREIAFTVPAANGTRII
ncbi:hypothetical protein Ga0466249_005308 [Sporomusaceae bacterium BoRhaA]|uniref:pyocin knob domain-containing protein n=1 Tax=Pelorhabdus rhamnosifermentans TaxID=2772457 RepID=UPI001C0609D5|nr:pyocin knob domain-containing protein [Pelorhabdus rhamnosifermentans]MBU2704154.1 hypothetical protein [Pelorhabdus rhamnosifermentans]